MTTRTALVTGAGRGIGAAIAAAMREQGWQVLTPPRSTLDLAEPQSVEQYLNSIAGQVIDGLVINAGVNNPAPLGTLSDADWARIQQVNLTSAFTLISALAPGMAKRGFGRIVGISSAYASRARAGRAAYSASKSALEALIRTTAVEFAARGVIANCVAPGFVDTELTRANNPPEVIAKLLERVPVGRLASTQEIADVVAFLMAESNGYLTGQVIPV
ncbi:MAG: SDR family NAD(P)-dependent oxidoreductase, partial [Actinomycetales bacterium]